ncbi:MAG TPA: lysophospholipid acyltransferase family protein [Kiritimatiellia bacterium]|jgi:1-acyl-sn-glycerol-3-phosphate acyltransferase|nr:lysophospholipid acyltransferase family protein [Kiritimatiellia bacterium]HPS09526.1 lysophospholipid acyltransferase family protein [Kiritimatiellia bacterium]
MTALLITWLTRFITGANIRWLGCEPVPRQRIYFANHTSHFDGVVMWAALPPKARKDTRPVAAADYWMATPVRRYLARSVFHCVLIDRHNVSVRNNPLVPILEALDAHASLILFPEGGRKNGGDAGEFKSGLYHLCRKRPDIECVPVYIDNMNRILPRGEILPVPLLSCITFGAPIRLAENEPKRAFLERARNAVNELRHA